MNYDLSKETGPFDIIGDVHGCFSELKEILTLLGYHQKQDIFYHPAGRKIIFLGDLGDRGPSSLKSIKMAMQMVQLGNALYVPGNHCKKFSRYLAGRSVQVKYGLEKTVEELKRLTSVEREIFTKAFTDFYQRSSPYLLLDNGNLVVAHAGIKEQMIGRVGKKIESFCLYGDTTGQVTPDGLPVRRDWAKDYRGKALVVYGHTPVKKPEFRNNTIDIDTGCAMGGYLTALRYPEQEIIQVPAQEVYYIRQ